jgi:hypothetical protein
MKIVRRDNCLFLHDGLTTILLAGGPISCVENISLDGVRYEISGDGETLVPVARENSQSKPS